MTGTWTKWESLVINGVFPLRRFLSRSNHSVVFLTEYRNLNAAIKLIPAHPTRSEAQLAHWRTIAGLSHPRLIRLFDSGPCQIAGHPFVFVVMDLAEQTLAQVLPHRPLTAEEAREMLAPALDALAFIHGKGLVHRKLKPANFLVVNDQLKLASDTVRPAGDSRAGGAKLTAYDPPEARDGVTAAAGDIWALGMTLVETLTQRLPVWTNRGPDTPTLPDTLCAEFAPMVRRCLSYNPIDRPTVGELKALIALPDPAGAGSAASTTAAVTAPVATTPPVATPPVATPPVATPPVATPPVGRPAVGPPVEFAPAPSPIERKVQPTPEVVAASPSRRALLIAIVAAASLAAIWAGPRMIHPRPRPTPPPSSVAPLPAPLPTAPPAAVLPRPPAPGGPPAVLHAEIPELSRDTRARVRGHIKITVLVTVDPSGNVVAATLKNAGSSRYFARLASEAARKWRFSLASNQAPRQALVHFDFTREGASGLADYPVHAGD